MNSIHKKFFYLSTTAALIMVALANPIFATAYDRQGIINMGDNLYGHIDTSDPGLGMPPNIAAMMYQWAIVNRGTETVSAHVNFYTSTTQDPAVRLPATGEYTLAPLGTLHLTPNDELAGFTNQSFTAVVVWKGATAVPPVVGETLLGFNADGDLVMSTTRTVYDDDTR